MKEAMSVKNTLKFALDVLDKTGTDYGSKQWEYENEAITAIKEALAQPEQGEHLGCIEYIPCCTDKTCPKCRAATPQQRTWVGLTDEDKLHIEIMGGKSDVMLAEMVEAKLKEKNT